MTLNPRGVFLPASNADVHGDTRKRLVPMEQAQMLPAPPGRFCLTAVNDPTLLYTSAETQRWRAWDGAVFLDYATVICNRDGLDPDDIPVDLNVVVFRNGDSVANLFVASDQFTAVRSADGVRFTPTDVLSVAAVGALFRDICVQMWMRGNGGGGLTFHQNDEVPT